MALVCIFMLCIEWGLKPMAVTIHLLLMTYQMFLVIWNEVYIHKTYWVSHTIVLRDFALFSKHAKIYIKVVVCTTLCELQIHLMQVLRRF